MSSNPQRPLVKPPDFIPLQSTQIINIPQNTSKAVISKNVHSSADEENGNGRANIMDSLNKPSLIPVNKPPLLSKPTLVSGNGQFEPISMLFISFKLHKPHDI
jgi:hypothetical protein